MQVAEFQLKGWMAVPALILVVIVLLIRSASLDQALHGDAAEQIKLHLQGVYAGVEVDAMRVALAAGDEDAIAAKAGDIVALEQIELVDVSARGATGDEVIARFEIRVAGATPPDGRPVRYFRLEHNTFSGWRVLSEARAFSYYLKLF